MSELAWAAGFIEGEGCLGLYTAKRGGGRRSEAFPVLEVGNTELPLLEALAKLFEGKPHLAYRSHYAKSTFTARKDYYIWRITHRKAHAAVKKLLPFLKGRKKKAAEAIIDFYDKPHMFYRDEKGRFTTRTWTEYRKQLLLKVGG